MNTKKPVVAQLDPSKIRASRWSTRQEQTFADKAFTSFQKEIASSKGNIQPIKVRPLSPGEEFEYEIIFGHRRHRACLYLKLPVSAFVVSIDEQQLFIEMDRENRLRADLRPYEQGEMYRKALDEGLYSNANQLATAVGVKPSNVSTALALARLPEVVLAAFPSRLDLQYRWASPLAKAAGEGPGLLVARAHEILSRRSEGESISATETLKALLQTATEPRVIKVNGKPVASVKSTGGRYVIAFDKAALSDTQASKIQSMISDFLQNEENEDEGILATNLQPLVRGAVDVGSGSQEKRQAVKGAKDDGISIEDLLAAAGPSYHR